MSDQTGDLAHSNSTRARRWMSCCAAAMIIGLFCSTSARAFIFGEPIPPLPVLPNGGPPPPFFPPPVVGPLPPPPTEPFLPPPGPNLPGGPPAGAPEPGTIAMTLIGLSVSSAGVIWRRKRATR